MEQPQQTERIRVPKQGEMLARVTEMLGSGRMRAQCEDGKLRMIRIPGKLRKRVWTRVGDLIIIIPWEIGGDAKADLEWRYTETQVEQLRKRGFAKNI